MSVIAKFRCDHVEDTSQDENNQSRQILMNAVIAYGENGERKDENESWSKWTPSGQISIYITNPDAFNQFVAGKDYYITFQEA